MTAIELFRKYFENEYPNENQTIVEIEEHKTVQDTIWVKIIFKDPELRKSTLTSNPDLFSFADILAKTIGYTGVIVGSMTTVLELYICGDTESRWWEPGSYGVLGTSGMAGTSGTAGYSGMTFYSGITTTNPCNEIVLPEIRTTPLEPIPITPDIKKNTEKWYDKIVSKRRRR